MGVRNSVGELAEELETIDSRQRSRVSVRPYSVRERREWAVRSRDDSASIHES